MDHFQYSESEAYCERVPLKVIAERIGTPAYVYSRATLRRHLEQLLEAFAIYPTLACFAVKANSNLTLLGEVARAGLGADVVSVGELERALKAGIPAQKIVFSGVGKTEPEIVRGLEAEILSFNVESEAELAQILATAKKQGKTARVTLRLNPNIDAKTNPYIATGLYSTKFGIPEDQLETLLPLFADSHLKLVGLSCHIGSQILTTDPFREAANRMAQAAMSLKKNGFELEFIDMGGGVGIRYDEESPPSLQAYAQTLADALAPTGLKLIIEPGRVVVGNAGVLLTKVIYSKKSPTKNFTIVDAAMNDLLRPSIYGSKHTILPVQLSDGRVEVTDVVGPVCESGDFLAKEIELPQQEPGDLLFVRGCGAYAATMASNYNSRPRAPEVLVDGDHFFVIRRRETMDDLLRNETIPDGLTV